mgnify:FL=1
MKTFLYVVMGIAISMVGIPVSQAANLPDMTEPTKNESVPLTMVSGTVMDVQGDWCIVQDSQGTEWKIQVDNYTDTIGNVMPGAIIAAVVEADGHAKKVKVMQHS